MNGEPEVGSFDPVEVERRARWVAEWETSPGLGHIQRNCNGCGSEWPLGSTQCRQCGGNIFTERPIEAQPVIGLDRLKGWVTRKPAAQPEPVPDPAVRAALVRIATLAAMLVAALEDADIELRRSVNEPARPPEYGHLQSLLAEAASQAGDTRPGDFPRLTQMLHSMQQSLELGINPPGVKT